MHSSVIKTVHFCNLTVGLEKQSLKTSEPSETLRPLPVDLNYTFQNDIIII